MRHLFRHRADVTRKARAPVGGKVLEQSPTLAFTGVRCLIEALSARERETVLGRVSSARYRMTWGTEDIREKDVIVWNGGSYIVSELTDDTTRPSSPYKTAVLSRAGV